MTSVTPVPSAADLPASDQGVAAGGVKLILLTTFPARPS